MRKYRRVRRMWRRIALPFVLVFAWSATLGTAQAVGMTTSTLNQAAAAADQPTARELTGAEMRSIRGSQFHVLSYATASGDTYGWEGKYAGTNTGNGNKQTAIPIVSWVARGGLPVELVLYHNSEGNHNSELANKWTFSFDWYADVDGSGNVLVHHGDDLAVSYHKNIDGSYSPPEGIHDGLVANGSPISSYDLTTHGQIKYHFTNPNSTGWHLASYSDPNGNSVTVNRDSGNLVTSVVDANSRTLSFTYTSGKITGISDPLSRSWSISYTSGNLTQITFPTVGGNSYNCQFGYDSNHNITTYTDKRGHSWTFSYDSFDNSLTWIKDPYNNETDFDYGMSGTTITDPNGHTIRHSYNMASGALATVTDQLSNQESYTWDSHFNKTGLTDRRNKSWSWTYDSNGNCLTATDPLNHTTTWTWSSKNRMLSEECALGHKTVWTYDATLGWNLEKIERKNSGGTVLSTTTFTNNGYGLCTAKTDDNNHETDYGYGTNGDLTSVTTPNGRVTSWTVNALGVRDSRTDALSNTTYYTLDAWNRVTCIDYPSGTDPTFTWDAESNLTQMVDANGTFAWTFDNANRKTAESLDGTTTLSLSYL